MQNAPSITESNLPNNDPLTTPVVQELMGTIQKQQHEIEQLKHRLDLLLKRIYGPRADKIDPNQKLMFEEQIPEPVAARPEPEPEYKLVKPLKKGHGRKFLPENLRREIVVVDVTDAEKSVIGGTWVQIGEAVTEKLDYTPASLFVQRTVRPKYVVRFAKLPECMVVADLPLEAMPKCKAAPGLVADVIVSKMVDHMPLYRQEKRHSRQGEDMSRSTIGGWLRDVAVVLLPLYKLLKNRVLAENVVHTHDTPIPVQYDSKEHCGTGRLWVYVSPGGTVHDSTPDRCRDGARRNFERLSRLSTM
jgi:transposase